MPGFTPTKRRVRFAGIVSRRRESAAVEGITGGDRLRRRGLFAGEPDVVVVEMVDEERERVMRVPDDGRIVPVETDSEILASFLWRL